MTDSNASAPPAQPDTPPDVRHCASPVDIQPLANVIASLRAPDGCPWDRAQTHLSLVPFLMEESWEFAEAVENGDPVAVCEELGDVLLQVVLHAQLADEAGQFRLSDVCAGIERKMVERHPHVFDRASDLTAEDVETAWAAAKARKRVGQSLLYGIPLRMPALQRADKLSTRAATVGFDWQSPDEVMAKVHEEVDELQEALRSGDREHAIDELGDLLFALVNLARKLETTASEALHRTSDRFGSRFRSMESIAVLETTPLNELTADQLEGLWRRAKAIERGQDPSKGE
jgi:MazG family protein